MLYLIKTKNMFFKKYCDRDFWERKYKIIIFSN